MNELNTSEESSVPVELLHRKVAAFNVKDSEFYQDDYDLYQINFFIPKGIILDAYDADGKLIRTARKVQEYQPS